MLKVHGRRTYQVGLSIFRDASMAEWFKASVSRTLSRPEMYWGDARSFLRSGILMDYVRVRSIRTTRSAVLPSQCVQLNVVHLVLLPCMMWPRGCFCRA